MAGVQWLQGDGFTFTAENLATLRRLALKLLKRETTKKRGIRGKQKNAGWNHAYLLRLPGL